MKWTTENLNPTTKWWTLYMEHNEGEAGCIKLSLSVAVIPWEPIVRQSEVRVRAEAVDWLWLGRLSVHWLEYLFLELWADFMLFLDTGSERGHDDQQSSLAPQRLYVLIFKKTRYCLYCVIILMTEVDVQLNRNQSFLDSAARPVSCSAILEVVTWKSHPVWMNRKIKNKN